MGINARWDNRDKTAILLEFETEWSFSELEEAIRRMDEMITSVPHQVDVLIDVEGAKMPKDVMNMAGMLLSSGEARTNEGNRIVIGASSMVRNGYSALTRLFPDKLKGRQLLFADDLHQARAVLHSLR